MLTTPKATAALALLALGWVGAAATPAVAEGDAVHGAADKAAAYEAEGLGTTTDRFDPSTDVLPTVGTNFNVGGIEVGVQTDAGLASLLGIGGEGAAASAPRTAAVSSPNMAAGVDAGAVGSVGGYPLISPLHRTGNQ